MPTFDDQGNYVDETGNIVVPAGAFGGNDPAAFQTERFTNAVDQIKSQGAEPSSADKFQRIVEDARLRADQPGKVDVTIDKPFTGDDVARFRAAQQQSLASAPREGEITGGNVLGGPIGSEPIDAFSRSLADGVQRSISEDLAAAQQRTRQQQLGGLKGTPSDRDMELLRTQQQPGGQQALDNLLSTFASRSGQGAEGPTDAQTAQLLGGPPPPQSSADKFESILQDLRGQASDRDLREAALRKQQEDVLRRVDANRRAEAASAHLQSPAPANFSAFAAQPSNNPFGTGER